MKGQILSRIQSYQNIPSHTTSSSGRLPANNNNKIVNEAKFLKYTTILTRESPNHSLKMLSPSPKMKSHRFLISNQALSSNKKLSSTTANRDVKRSLNYELASVRKTSELKNCKINQRGSEKHLSFNHFQKYGLKTDQNQPSNQTIQNHQSKPNNACIKKQLFKQGNHYGIGRRKELMRIYSKIDIGTGMKTEIGSQQNIRTLECNEESKDPEIHHIKQNMMMKTANAFIKPSPYLNFSNKKFSIKSPQKKAPTKSLNRIPTITLAEKEVDVSIQISLDDQGKLQQKEQKIQNQSMEFGCSQIKEKEIDNDSSFLEAAQKDFFNQLQDNDKKQEHKKRKWRKLPSDFLKV